MEAPESEYCPAAHPVHLDEVAEAEAPTKRPEAQSTQLVIPWADWYLPTLQVVQLERPSLLV
jgi:hypothetical protein